MNAGGTDTCPQVALPSVSTYFGQVSVCATQEAFPLTRTPRPPVLRTPTIVRRILFGWHHQLRTTVGATHAFELKFPFLSAVTIRCPIILTIPA